MIGFLEKNFGKLPKWARVTSYFVMLLLFVYMSLAPRFINGQVVAMKKSGGTVPYRGVDLQIRMDGRTMKFQTNEDGYWSIPLASRLPESVRLKVYHQDESAWFEATIETMDIWKKIWSNEFRVTVSSEEPRLKIELVARTEHSILKGIVRLANALIATASAELFLPATIKPEVVRDVAKEKKSVDSEILQAYVKAAGTSAPDNLAAVPIVGKSGLSYVERIDMISGIEAKLDIKIPDQHWKSFRTLGEISDYVIKRKALEANDSKFRVNQSNDWADIEVNSPAEQRPQFRVEQGN